MYYEASAPVFHFAFLPHGIILLAFAALLLVVLVQHFDPVFWLYTCNPRAPDPRRTVSLRTLTLTCGGWRQLWPSFRQAYRSGCTHMRIISTATVRGSTPEELYERCRPTTMPSHTRPQPRLRLVQGGTPLLRGPWCQDEEGKPETRDF